ncbi:hypothetical protein IFM89_031999 [Coptis chinensis]|uniref:DUF641 domain-containing protein n=1 Tax=Coptis chinensis TaxID=261450 RepID=A0A835IJB8_9MAGN|nr:hypothetical protein IFM89_031999 [Coptis chinensis]
MLDMDPSQKQPQISEMFQKFAIAFKAKTIEFFAEEEEVEEDFQTLSLSEEEIITNQRVVVIKPDSKPFPQTLISSLFATISSFEASYLQLQTAHSPFIPQNIEAADRAAVSHLQKLSEIKKWYKDFLNNSSNPTTNLLTGSHFEAQVEENQSVLRTLEMLVNRLQLEIDSKDAEVLVMKQKLKKNEVFISELSKRVGTSKSSILSSEKLLTVGAFDKVLNYVWMFQGFDSVNFGLIEEDGIECNGCLRQFVEHAAAYVDMASSVWMLHKLAFSFDPVVEIFQVEQGVDFSMIYMENVTGKGVVALGKARAKVAFTVIPGFKIGRTIIQSQVYLKGTMLGQASTDKESLFRDKFIETTSKSMGPRVLFFQIDGCKTAGTLELLK